MVLVSLQFSLIDFRKSDLDIKGLRGVFRRGAMGAQPPPGKVKALIFRGVSAPNGG